MQRANFTVSLPQDTCGNCLCSAKIPSEEAKSLKMEFLSASDRQGETPMDSAVAADFRRAI